MKKIKLNLTLETIAKIALAAHKEDITFNEYCNRSLKEYIKELENERKNTKSIKTPRKR